LKTISFVEVDVTDSDPYICYECCSELYVAGRIKRQRRMTKNRTLRQPESRDARPANYRHLYQIRRFNGDVIAQVIRYYYY